MTRFPDFLAFSFDLQIPRLPIPFVFLVKEPHSAPPDLPQFPLVQNSLSRQRSPLRVFDPSWVCVGNLAIVINQTCA